MTTKTRQAKSVAKLYRDFCEIETIDDLEFNGLSYSDYQCLLYALRSITSDKTDFTASTYYENVKNWICTRVPCVVSLKNGYYILSL